MESNWRICLIEELKENGVLIVICRFLFIMFVYIVCVRVWDRLSVLVCLIIMFLGWLLVFEVKIM